MNQFLPLFQNGFSFVFVEHDRNFEKIFIFHIVAFTLFVEMIIFCLRNLDR